MFSRFDTIPAVTDTQPARHVAVATSKDCAMLSRRAGIGGGALYAVYAEAYTVFLCVCERCL